MVARKPISVWLWLYLVSVALAVSGFIYGLSAGIPSVLSFRILAASEQSLQVPIIEVPGTPSIKHSAKSQGNYGDKGLLSVFVLRGGVPAGNCRVEVQIGRPMHSPQIKAGDVSIRILTKSGQEIPSVAMKKDSARLPEITNAGSANVIADFQVPGNGRDVATVEVKFGEHTYSFELVD